jgi:hypothetical protein
MGYLTNSMSAADHVDAAPVRLVEIFSTLSTPEAEVVRGLLESERIPVVVKGMSQGPYRMGATHLYVPEDAQDAARAVIRDALAMDLDPETPEP